MQKFEHIQEDAISWSLEWEENSQKSSSYHLKQLNSTLISLGNIVKGKTKTNAKNKKTKKKQREYWMMED